MEWSPSCARSYCTTAVSYQSCDTPPTRPSLLPWFVVCERIARNDKSMVADLLPIKNWEFQPMIAWSSPVIATAMSASCRRLACQPWRFDGFCKMPSPDHSPDVAPLPVSNQPIARWSAFYWLSRSLSLTLTKSNISSFFMIATNCIATVTMSVLLSAMASCATNGPDTKLSRPSDRIG